MMSPLAAVQVNSNERLSADDQATLAEEQHLAAALHAQQQTARAQMRAHPGTCANCSAVCLKQAVYCDADCRADHEQRLRHVARVRGRR